MSISSIQPGEIARQQAHGEKFYLLDVRSPAEFEQLHAEGAVNLPLGDLRQRASLPQDCCGPVCILCQSGQRAREAARILDARGGDSVFLVVEGGTERWLATGLPVVRGQSTGWSIERQVRLVVGCFILLGVTLNRIGFDPAIYLAGFMGLGLTFAGLTNTCGMGLLLAQMPWNRRRALPRLL